MPNVPALTAGRAADALRGMFGLDPALSYEAPWLVANGRPTDNSRAVDDLGIKFRPLDTTIADTVDWLTAARHI